MSEKLGLVGRKIGMTRIFTDDGVSVPVTVLDVSNNRVTMVKTQDTDGYTAVQVAFGTKKPSRVSKPLAGQFAKAGSVSMPRRLPSSSPARPSLSKSSRKARRST